MSAAPSVVSIEEARGKPGAAALRYAALGWKVFPVWWVEEGSQGRACACGKPCTSPGKHPISAAAPFGQNSASAESAIVRAWWERFPKANIAVALSSSGLCAIDIDPRNGGFYTIESIEAEHGPLVSDVLQFSGGGGEHRIFAAPEGTNLPGKLGPGVDVKLNGYIVLEPSNHLSGRQYAFEASSSPLEGAVPSPLPDWLRGLVVPARAPAEGEPGPALPLGAEEIEELRDALAALPPAARDDRDTWLRMGFALHNDLGGQAGYDLWTEWSKASPKFDPVDQIRVWRSFKRRGLEGVTKASIFKLAMEHGWLNTGARPLVEAPAIIAAPRPDPEPAELPAELLQPPGIAGEITAWIEASARKSQPQFSVQAALAFVATLLGRRFVTNRRNWPSLYFLNIGQSGSGKEHAKWAVEHLLEACQLERLIGPGHYTSESGVLSALVHQPSHVSIADEWGKVLEASKARDNSRAASTIKALIEIWGRCDGVIRPIGFSTFGLSKDQAEELRRKSVRKPALTLLALSTPETFYAAVSSGAARDGHLNRFLVVESAIGRKPGREASIPTLPARLADWVGTVHGRAGKGTQVGLVNPDIAHDLDPAPAVVPFEATAERALAAFERDCLAQMDALEDEGLAELWSRSTEIAMRLALQLAVGLERPTIGTREVDWAIAYVRHYTACMVEAIRGRVADSPFEAACQQVYAAIARKPSGLTEREITRHCRAFRALDTRRRADILAALAHEGRIAQTQTPSLSGRGRQRKAWLSISGTEEET